MKRVVGWLVYLFACVALAVIIAKMSGYSDILIQANAIIELLIMKFIPYEATKNYSYPMYILVNMIWAGIIILMAGIVLRKIKTRKKVC